LLNNDKDYKEACYHYTKNLKNLKKNFEPFDPRMPFNCDSFEQSEESADFIKINKE